MQREMDSYTLNLILCFVKKERRRKTRINATKTIYNNRKNSKIPNSKNIEIIHEFLEYMRNNGSSEHHQNNNLKNIWNITSIAVCLENIETIVNQNKNRMRVIATIFFER